jgi:hypothetical protein
LGLALVIRQATVPVSTAGTACGSAHHRRRSSQDVFVPTPNVFEGTPRVLHKDLFKTIFIAAIAASRLTSAKVTHVNVVWENQPVAAGQPVALVAAPHCAQIAPDPLP